MGARTTTRLEALLRSKLEGVLGVSIGDETDRATWRVNPAHLQAQAQPLIDAFTLPSAADLAAEDADRDIGDAKMLALSQALWEAIPSPLLTKAQVLARAKQLYRSLVVVNGGG